MGTSAPQPTSGSSMAVAQRQGSVVERQHQIQHAGVSALSATEEHDSRGQNAEDPNQPPLYAHSVLNVQDPPADLSYRRPTYAGLDRRKRGTIILNKPDAVYFAGQIITGTFNMDVHQIFKCHSLKFFVRAYLSYHDYKMNIWSTEIQKQQCRHRILGISCHLSLDASDKYGSCFHLHPGSNCFPFTITLPDNCPPSFATSDLFPSLCYFAMVQSQIDFMHTETIAILPLHVLTSPPPPPAIVDKLPVCRESTAELTVLVCANRAWFAAPDKVGIRVRIRNTGSEKMDNIYCILVQQITAKLSTLERPVSYGRLMFNEGTVKNGKWTGRVDLILPGFFLQATESIKIHVGHENLWVQIRYLVKGSINDDKKHTLLSFEIPITMRNDDANPSLLKQPDAILS